MKKPTYDDVVSMFNAIDKKHEGEVLILDSHTGQLRYVQKDKFISVGTLEVGYIDDEEAEDD